jgi:uncharacterized Zn finger protein
VSVTVDEQARRLLAGGFVQILFASEGSVTARVRGVSSGIHDVEWSRLGGWSCTCARGPCSHQGAVQLCTTTTTPERP